ncbi:MAG: hypothetical protein MJY77_06575 [Bacteroidaceae bacterium]|nr:hypothetical protein [Bacteroidaceae bacterium]
MIVSSETELLDAFERKIRKLVAMYNDLKRENESLRKDIVDAKLREDELRNKISQLQSNYENLKLTKVLSVSGHDLDSTRKRVSGLVREIDRCIDMLKI